jgi:hypothetical protein
MLLHRFQFDNLLETVPIKHARWPIAVYRNRSVHARRHCTRSQHLISVYLAVFTKHSTSQRSGLNGWYVFLTKGMLELRLILIASSRFLVSSQTLQPRGYSSFYQLPTQAISNGNHRPPPPSLSISSQSVGRCDRGTLVWISVAVPVSGGRVRVLVRVLVRVF